MVMWVAWAVRDLESRVSM